MIGQRFSLLPFTTDRPLPDIKIIGSISRSTNIIAIKYELQGALSEIVFPEQAVRMNRNNNLWQATCFELFLGIQGSAQYWEFNLSPAGHWNIYRFASYRQDMHEEQAFVELPFTVEQGKGYLRLALEIDLSNIIQADEALDVGVSAVIECIDGSLLYWALRHPCERPDFHSRESFIIKL